jgi:hypothetical protein
MHQFLFVSYTGALTGLVQGRVAPTDLQAGLFYFGCSREAFLYGVLPCGPSLEDVRDASLAYLKLEHAVLTAEAEGRLQWRLERGKPSYTQLNQLLAQNGLKALSGEGEYAYPGVRNQMAQTNPNVEVLY